MESVEPDGGWGWVVVLSAHVVFLLCNGLYLSMGVFLVALLNYFGENTASSSLVLAISGAMAAVTAPLAGYSVRKCGERITMVIAGFIGVIGLVGNTFAPNLQFLYFSHGVLVGGSIGVGNMAAQSILSRYFKKRHAMASSIATSGTLIGVMVIPPCTQFLMDIYGWRGAMLIFTGVFSNIFVAAALMKPVDKSVKKVKSVNECTNVCTCKTICRVTGFDLLTKYPSLYLLITSLVLLGYSYVGNCIYLMPYAIDLGIPALTASTLMSVFGLSSLVGRLGLGWVIDKRFTTPLNAMAISFCCYVTFSYIVAGCKGFVCMAVGSAGLGTFHGVIGVLKAVVVKDIIGSKDFAVVYGLCMLFAGIGETVVLCVSGLIYDSIHSYSQLYVINGTIMVLATMLLILLSCRRRCHWSQSERQDDMIKQSCEGDSEISIKD